MKHQEEARAGLHCTIAIDASQRVLHIRSASSLAKVGCQWLVVACINGAGGLHCMGLGLPACGRDGSHAPATRRYKSTELDIGKYKVSTH